MGRVKLIGARALGLKLKLLRINMLRKRYIFNGDMFHGFEEIEGRIRVFRPVDRLPSNRTNR